MTYFKPLICAFLLPLSYHIAAADISKGTKSSFSIEARNILAQDTISWSTKLPFDNQVIKGKLKNGFTYYILKNKEPENRVTMYLANKVGSVLETEEERGLAHFLEHMQFNGLKHFPKNELIDYLQKAGVRFGADLNAYTSFNETVYQLPIPSDDPELLKNGLQVIRDWAQDALLTEEEIHKERSVVLEEMRIGKGAHQRMRDQYLPFLLNNSIFSNRLPLGTPEVIQHFSPETLRQFHKKWYRPDLQAVIIVGDIDVHAIEAEVKRLFSDLKTPADAPGRSQMSVDLLDKNQFMAVSDAEMPYVVGQLFYKYKKEKIRNLSDYRKELHKSVFNQLLGSRLLEIMQQANPPFLQGQGSFQEFLGGIDVLGLNYVAKPGEIESGFKALMQEMERVKRFGFTQTEFDRAIKNMLKSNELAYNERDKKKSDSYINSYLNNFLKEDPALSNEDRYQISKQLIPSLTLTELNQLMQDYDIHQNRDIIYLSSEKEQAHIPNEEQVNQWIAEVENAEISPYIDPISSLPLLKTEPKAGTILQKEEIPEIGVQKLTLSNGVSVILKPTNFKNDEIKISAFSPGGSSLYADSDFYSADNSTYLVGTSGLGQLNKDEFTRFMTGKAVQVFPTISERYEGISAVSDKDGLKTAFELIYGYFVEPKVDDQSFQSFMSRNIAALDNKLSDPNAVFSDSINQVLYGNQIRRLNPTVEFIQSTDKDRALEIYKERFADASDFTFVIVGSFTESEIHPYLEQYLAALPNIHRKESARYLGILEPQKGVQKTVFKGKEDKATVILSYIGDYAYSEQKNLDMDALASILSVKLLERLREEEGGVYGVSARINYKKFPNNRYRANITFGTGKDQVESLIQATKDEIQKIQKNGPAAIDLEKFKMEERRQLEVSLRENSFWLGHLTHALQNQEDPTYILTYLQEVDKLTAKRIQKAAQEYLKDNQRFQFILLPEQEKPE